MKILCIVNRTAGAGKTGRIWPSYHRRLQEMGLAVECVYTEGPGHALELAARGSREYEHLVAVGGDGTVHEVVNGMFGSAAMLSVLPTGKGNDLARTLGIPRDITAVDRLKHGRTRTVDVVQLGERYFINGASVGFDAEVAHQVNLSRLPLRGKTLYVGIALKTLFQFKGCEVTLELEEETVTKRGLLVVFANGQYYGGGLRIAPPADVSDGLMDICFVEELSKPSLVFNLALINTGRHMHHPQVRFFRAKRACVRSERPLRVQADGEVLGTTPCTLEVKPGSLTVFA